MILHARLWAGLAIVTMLVLGGCTQNGEAATAVDPVTAESTAIVSSPPTPVPIPSPVVIEVPYYITVTVPSEVQAPGPCDEPRDTIVIGAILPLSSPGAIRSGFAMQSALNLALNDITSIGGIRDQRVQLITYDSAGIPTRAAKYAERLITEDCATAIVGLYHNNVATAVRDVAQTHGVPLILAEPAADHLTSGQTPEVFRIAPTASMVSGMDAEWLSEVGDYNGDGELLAVVVVPDTNYGQLQAEQAEISFPERGIEVKTLIADLPAVDFSPVIARIVDTERTPDALFIKIYDDSALALQRQLLDAGIGPEKGTIIVTTSPALDDEKFWALMPDGENTVVQQVGPWYSTVTPIGALFATNYLGYFDRWPERYAFASYDAFMIAADAIERADSTAHADVLAALEGTEIELASGLYHFPFVDRSPPGPDVPDYMWHQWPDTPTLFLQYDEPQQSAEQMTVIWPDVYQTVDEPYVR